MPLYVSPYAGHIGRTMGEISRLTADVGRTRARGIMGRGQAEAQALADRGNISAGMWSTFGQIAGGVGQEYQRRQEPGYKLDKMALEDAEAQRRSQGMLRQALTTTRGNYDKAADLLDEQGHYDLAGEFRSQLAKQRTTMLEGADKSIDVRRKVILDLERYSRGIDLSPEGEPLSPEVARQNYARVYPLLKQTAEVIPELASQIPEPDAFDPAILPQFRTWAEEVGTYSQRLQAGIQGWLRSDPKDRPKRLKETLDLVAPALAMAQTPEEVDQAYQLGNQLGTPREIIYGVFGADTENAPARAKRFLQGEWKETQKEYQLVNDMTVDEQQWPVAWDKKTNQFYLPGAEIPIPPEKLGFALREGGLTAKAKTSIIERLAVAPFLWDDQNPAQQAELLPDLPMAVVFAISDWKNADRPLSPQQKLDAYHKWQAGLRAIDTSVVERGLDPGGSEAQQEKARETQAYQFALGMADLPEPPAVRQPSGDFLLPSGGRSPAGAPRPPMAAPPGAAVPMTPLGRIGRDVGMPPGPPAAMRGPASAPDVPMVPMGRIGRDVGMPPGPPMVAPGSAAVPVERPSQTGPLRFRGAPPASAGLVRVLGPDGKVYEGTPEQVDAALRAVGLR